MNTFLTLLNAYLDGVVDVEAIRSWIAQNVWHAQEAESRLIDQVAVELADLDEETLDESEFRTRIADIVMPTFTTTLDDQSSLRQTMSSTPYTDTVLLEARVYPEGEVTELRLDAVVG